MPKVGDQYVTTYWNGNANAIIETTKIEPTSYNQITSEFAEIEGEGDRSLSHRRKAHQACYKQELAPYKEKFDESMIIIYEYYILSIKNKHPTINNNISCQFSPSPIVLADFSA